MDKDKLLDLKIKFIHINRHYWTCDAECERGSDAHCYCDSRKEYENYLKEVFKLAERGLQVE
jgi:hypothetical protein